MPELLCNRKGGCASEKCFAKGGTNIILLALKAIFLIAPH